MNAFDVLGDPIRRRILELLAEHDSTSGQVVDVIRSEFGVTQAAVSQHLRVLRMSGFARSAVDGPRRIYSIEPGRFAEVDAWLSRFRVFWERSFDALEIEVARGKGGK